MSKGMVSSSSFAHVCAGICVLLTVAAAAPAWAGTISGQWQPRATIPYHVYGHASAELDGKVHLLGGCHTSDWTSPTTRHQIYDPVADSWASAANLPLDLGWSMPAALDDKLYLFGGGYHRSGLGLCATDQAWVYDPETDRWTALPPMPDKRMNGCAVALGDSIYICMGYNRQGGVGTRGVLAEYHTAYRYHPSTGTYSPVASSPQTGCYIAAGPHAGKLCAVVGTHHEGDTIEERGLAEGALIYDPASDQWTRLAAKRVMPRVFYLTQCSASVIRDGRLYVVGGRSAAGRTRITSYFDIEGQRFVRGPDLPKGRCCGGGAIAGSTLVISGGFLGQTGRPALETWVVTLGR